MGLFSYICPGCGHSVRHNSVVKPRSAWMTQAVLVTKHGATFGTYDGYGRLRSPSGALKEVLDVPSPTLYHEACYRVLGQPKRVKPSKDAVDQGVFVGEYDPKEPATIADLKRLQLGMVS